MSGIVFVQEDALAKLALFGALCLQKHRCDDDDGGDIFGEWLNEQARECGVLMAHPEASVTSLVIPKSVAQAIAAMRASFGGVI